MYLGGSSSSSDSELSDSSCECEPRLRAAAISSGWGETERAREKTWVGVSMLSDSRRRLPSELDDAAISVDVGGSALALTVSRRASSGSGSVDGDCLRFCRRLCPSSTSDFVPLLLLRSRGSALSDVDPITRSLCRGRLTAGFEGVGGAMGAAALVTERR